MFGLDWLTPSVLYVVCSGIVALLIAIEGIMLKKNDGSIPKSPIFHISSLIDTVWVFVSAIVIYTLDMPSFMLSVPIAYCLYSIGGWVYSSRVLKKNQMPKSINELVIPSTYIAYSQAFALVYFGLCAVVLMISSEMISSEFIQGFVS